VVARVDLQARAAVRLQIVAGARENTSKNRKKILNRGNELKDLLKIKELAVFGETNELVFERKRGPSK
jgi:hypothetical protein